MCRMKSTFDLLDDVAAGTKSFADVGAFIIEVHTAVARIEHQTAATAGTLEKRWAFRSIR
jgi:hypothetical protein